MMYFSSQLGKLYAKAKGVRKSILRVILLKLLRDPDIQFDVRGKNLIAPASHNLPLFVAEFPFYDELVIRVSNFLREKSGRLIMIDVGANIGDTIVTSNNSNSDVFLAVEAHQKFIKYLRQNCIGIQNLIIVEAFLSSTEREEERFSVVESKGTAQISLGGNKKIRMRTLDSILLDNPGFHEFNFLKIDTDGHDFRIIRGGRACISKAAPAVLFESEVCGNENYLHELQETFSFFREIGYSLAIVYDNFGYLFGAYNLDNLGNFKFPLFYQLTSKLYYFDILLMKPEFAQEFLEKELLYFSNSNPNELLKRLAMQVQKLPYSLR